MQITVQRSPANKQGPDIVSDLLTDEITGREKGGQAVDHSCSSRTIEQCQCPKREFIETGLLAQVTEAEKQWRGKVTYWGRTLTLDGDNDRFVADMALHIERVRDDG